ncbi:hypothetical protein GQ457_04G019070 [Hibiscus cannabinus]
MPRVLSSTSYDSYGRYLEYLIADVVDIFIRIHTNVLMYLLGAKGTFICYRVLSTFIRDLNIYLIIFQGYLSNCLINLIMICLMHALVAMLIVT